MSEARNEKRVMGSWLRAGCLAILLVSTPASLHAQSNCNDPEREQKFLKQLREVNERISEKQKSLKRKLYDLEATESQLKQLAKELSLWRMKREQLAIEYILQQRRVDCRPPTTIIDDR